MPFGENAQQERDISHLFSVILFLRLRLLQLDFFYCGLYSGIFSYLFYANILQLSKHKLERIND